MNYLANALSISVLGLKKMDFLLLRMKPIQPAQIPNDVKSCIGHEEIAKIASQILGFQVKASQIDINLGADDRLFVAQYNGTTIPDDATKLPDGASMKFFEVSINHGCGNCQDKNCDSCMKLNLMLR